MQIRNSGGKTVQQDIITAKRHAIIKENGIITKNEKYDAIGVQEYKVVRGKMGKARDQNCGKPFMPP